MEAQRSGDGGELSAEACDCLRDAITLAKNEQVRRLDALKSRLLRLGHPDAVVREAVRFWADHERAKHQDSRRSGTAEVSTEMSP